MIAPQYPREARKIIQEQIDHENILQKDLARSANIPATTLSMFLSGQRKPSIPLLEKCAQELGLLPEELISAQREYDAWSQTPDGKRVLAKESQISSPEKTPHGALSNWQIKLHYDLGDLKFNPPHFAELKFASVDLTRGKYKIVSKDLQTTYADTENLVLPKGESALIYSREKVTLPSFIAGRAGGISFHINHGIAVSFGLQLDPLFSGHPFALFTNNGAEPYQIAPGDPSLSVEFYYLAAEPDLELNERLE